MLKWRTGLPEESGYYLVLYVNEAGCAHVTESDYSARYKSWNCNDNLDPNKVAEYCIEGVRFWAPLETVIPAEFKFYTK